VKMKMKIKMITKHWWSDTDRGNESLNKIFTRIIHIN
jgi:hypothetical protein